MATAKSTRLDNVSAKDLSMLFGLDRMRTEPQRLQYADPRDGSGGIWFRRSHSWHAIKVDIKICPLFDLLLTHGTLLQVIGLSRSAS